MKISKNKSNTNYEEYKTMSIILEQSNEKQHIVEGLQINNCDLVREYSCID